MKHCPFNKEGCTKDCGLYISNSELNEMVKNRLTSIGVISKEEGICALKNLALAKSREIFENTAGKLS